MKGLRRLGMIRMNAMEFWMRIVDGDESEEVIRVRKVMRKQWVHLINSKQVTCWNWWDWRRNENMRCESSKLLQKALKHAEAI